MRSLASLAGIVVLTCSCGKSGGVANLPPSPGLYHLDDGATFLALQGDGSYVVHRRSEGSIGSTACGTWKQDVVSPSGHVVVNEGDYWPSPARFPSAVIQRVSLHGAEGGDLVVVGESDWAGSFSQTWTRGSKITMPPCTPRGWPG